MISINLSNVIDILANGDCPFLEHSCFQLKWFALFEGCNILISGASHVPKSRILVFNLNGLPFQGVQHNRFWGVGCPKNTLSYFPKKGFAVLGGCNRRFWPFWAQNCIIIYAHVPFLDILILKINVLAKSGHATLCVFS